MRTVWAWQVVQGSRNGKWLLIHFPARRASVLHSCYGETDENHGVGPAEKKKCCWFQQDKKYAPKNCAMTLCHIEL